MIAQNTHSANLTEVGNIGGEKITACNLSTNSVTAALVGAMRFNRVNITDKLDGVQLYHQVTAMNISGGCVAYITIEFKDYDRFFVKNLNKKIMTDIILCTSANLLTGPSHDMQRRVNDSAKDMAQQCLLEISKK